MGVNFDHHIKGHGGCQFSQRFWPFKVQMRKLIAGLKIKKRNVLAKTIFIATNLVGEFGRSTEEILSEQVVCFYINANILVGN